MLELGAAEVSSVVRRNHVTLAGRAEGPVMVFAHGFGCDQDMWRKLVPFFAKGYRLVLFDHVGAGRSDAAAYDPVKYGSLDGSAADLLEICACGPEDRGVGRIPTGVFTKAGRGQ